MVRPQCGWKRMIWSVCKNFFTKISLCRNLFAQNDVITRPDPVILLTVFDDWRRYRDRVLLSVHGPTII